MNSVSCDSYALCSNGDADDREALQFHSGGFNCSAASSTMNSASLPGAVPGIRASSTMIQASSTLKPQGTVKDPLGDDLAPDAANNSTRGSLPTSEPPTQALSGTVSQLVSPGIDQIHPQGPLANAEQPEHDESNRKDAEHAANEVGEPGTDAPTHNPNAPGASAATQTISPESTTVPAPGDVILCEVDLSLTQRPSSLRGPANLYNLPRTRRPSSIPLPERSRSARTSGLSTRRYQRRRKRPWCFDQRN